MTGSSAHFPKRRRQLPACRYGLAIATERVAIHATATDTEEDIADMAADEAMTCRLAFVRQDLLYVPIRVVHENCSIKVVQTAGSAMSAASPSPQATSRGPAGS